MLRTLLVGAAGVGIGYIIGVAYGFKAAVVDYVENDASKIQSMAADVYPSLEEGAATAETELPSIVEDALEEAAEQAEESDAKAFR